MQKKPNKIYRVQLSRMGSIHGAYTNMCQECIDNKNNKNTNTLFISTLFQVDNLSCSICKKPNIIKR